MVISLDNIIEFEVSILLLVIYFTWRDTWYLISYWNVSLALALLYLYYIILILFLIKLYQDYITKDLMDWEIPENLKYIDNYLYP